MHALSLPIRKPSYMNIQLLLFAGFFTALKVIETYVFRDWEYLKWILVLVVVDTVLGAVAAWRSRAFSSRGFSSFIPKAAIYGGVLVVTNVLQHFTIGGQHVEAFDWLAHLILVGIILRESISVLENAAKIDSRILPSWILRSLKNVETKIGEHAAPAGDRAE